jgi:hypothetical protein
MTDKLTAPLVNAVRAGLDMRFKDILNSDDYNVATMLLPKFKLNYLESSKRPAGKALLIKAMQWLTPRHLPHLRQNQSRLRLQP